MNDWLVGGVESKAARRVGVHTNRPFHWCVAEVHTDLLKPCDAVLVHWRVSPLGFSIGFSLKTPFYNLVVDEFLPWFDESMPKNEFYFMKLCFWFLVVGKGLGRIDIIKKYYLILTKINLKYSKLNKKNV